MCIPLNIVTGYRFRSCSFFF